MKARILALVSLIVSLVLVLGTLGVLAEGSQTGARGERVMAQQRAQNVVLVGQIGGATYAVASERRVTPATVYHTRWKSSNEAGLLSPQPISTPQLVSIQPRKVFAPCAPLRGFHVQPARWLEGGSTGLGIY